MLDWPTDEQGMIEHRIQENGRNLAYVYRK